MNFFGKERGRVDLSCKKVKASIFLIMKLTILISCCFVMLSFVEGHAQRFSFKVKKGTLQTAFEMIEKQSDYVFFYKKDLLKDAKEVDIDIRGLNLKEALDQILENQPVTYKIYQEYVVLHSKSQTPKGEILQIESDGLLQSKVTGQVVDSAGSVISGATVRIKGTDRITQTDKEGYFSFDNVDRDAVIVISCLGHRVEQRKVSDGVKLIRMRAFVSELSSVEVVASTGYQKIPKERATGSFEIVDNNTINQLVGSNIIDRLKGTTSLLFDNALNRPALALRGFSTIKGEKDLLVVLDNFPYEGDIENINPNDIENITLLKDAAAQSIWGTRAGNGVIVITTKKGKLNSPSTISFSNSTQIGQKPDLDYYNLMSSSEVIDLEVELYKAGLYKNSENLRSKSYISPVVAMLIANNKDKTKLSDEALAIELDKLRGIDNRKQYMDGVYRNALNQQYALNLTSGWDKLSLFMGVGYDKSRSSLESYGDRLSLRNNITYKLSNAINFNMGLNYSQRNSRSGREGYGQLKPYINLYDEDKNALAMPGLNPFYLETVKDYDLLDWNKYPYAEYKFNRNRGFSQNYNFSFDLNYKAFDWLNFNLMYNVDRQNERNRLTNNVEGYYARDLINMFSELDPISGKIKRNIPYGSILRNSQNELVANNYRLQMNIAKKWRDHQVDAVVGGEIRTIKADGYRFLTYGFDEEVLTTSDINYNLLYQDFVYGDRRYIPSDEEYNSTQNNFISQYFNGSYTYQSKYVLSASARQDASNLFGLETNDKWQPLWSIGGAWNISEESFYKDKGLPYLKLRATYGKSGLVNQALSAVSIIRYGTAYITNFQKANITQYNNPELRWEKSAMFNVGFDIGSSRDRVYGNVNYYRKKGIDLYGPSEMDLTAGVGKTISKNVANMAGYGWEVNVGAKIIDKAFKWNSNIAFNYTKSKVTKYFNDSQSARDFTTDGGSISPQVGQPLYQIVLFPFLRVNDKGEPVFSLDGQESTNYVDIYNSHYSNLVYAGSTVPVAYGFFTNTFSYKRVSLGINLTYKLGHHYQGPKVGFGTIAALGIANGSGNFKNRWQKPGDENFTNVPKFVYPLNSYQNLVYKSINPDVYKADHIRLNYIRLDYAVNPITVGNRRMNIRVFANGENLGILWKAAKTPYDPDFIENLPSAKRFSIGVNINL
ncbi:SusC/RagA family TonB-linked outer membrane protein [Sphingobacterium sp. xlx-130]|uniref:SusC/RagA family TonB-linked outer membrane protein n=2 Tax=Sphingobacteriaceae TaxID=84566 RepID=UPI0013DB90C0|nr:SusC/RagA family TonB-linked outer membrane protein [Sphingobacterium sp. xlx-130]